MFTPTPEQAAAVDAFTTGSNMILEAGAGTGKTSTLELLAQATPTKRGIYFAFNRSIADEAKERFPSNVQCATAHSLAYRAVGKYYRHRLNGGRVPARDAARILGINGPHRINEERAPLAPEQVARLVMGTVKKFCYSAATNPERWHVPEVTGLDSDADKRELAHLVVPLAAKAWNDITSPNGRLRFEHDHYLKMWQLTNPTLPADYVLLDEAQDTNGVVKAVFDAQTNAQRVAVGDANQSIYGWRGAVDALSAMADSVQHHLLLSQSFRFGPGVAAEANKWLTLLDARLRITGSGPESTVLDDAAKPDAVLCRTNATAIDRLMTCHTQGQRVAIVGGGKDLRSFAEAAEQLKATGKTWHPELMAFTSWGMVQDYVDHDDDGGDLKVFVKLVDEHGADVIIDAVDRAVPEKRADVMVSTAHKAKGREWNTVQVAGDFREPEDDPETGEPGELSKADAMLAYVTVTRAKHTLGRGGLAWVDQRPELAPAPAEQTPASEAVPV